MEFREFLNQQETYYGNRDYRSWPNSHGLGWTGGIAGGLIGGPVGMVVGGLGGLGAEWLLKKYRQARGIWNPNDYKETDPRRFDPHADPKGYVPSYYRDAYGRPRHRATSWRQWMFNKKKKKDGTQGRQADYDDDEEYP